MLRDLQLGVETRNKVFTFDLELCPLSRCPHEHHIIWESSEVKRLFCCGPEFLNLTHSALGGVDERGRDGTVHWVGRYLAEGETLAVLEFLPRELYLSLLLVTC